MATINYVINSQPTAISNRFEVPGGFWLPASTALCGLCCFMVATWRYLKHILSYSETWVRRLERGSILSNMDEKASDAESRHQEIIPGQRIPVQTQLKHPDSSTPVTLDPIASKISPPTANIVGASLPQVIMPQKLLMAIRDYIHEFIDKRGTGLEIGGMLIGQYCPAEGVNPPVIKLQGFIDAGPNAECCPGSILMDAAYQDRILHAHQLQNAYTDSQGMFHYHMQNLDENSAGDLSSDTQTVKESETGMLVFVIVTQNNDHDTPMSLRIDDLKLDVFVMARHLGARYHRVRPMVTSDNLIEPNRMLERVVEVRNESRADWALLRRIKGIGPLSIREIVNGEQSGLWLSTPTEYQGRTIHVHARNDGGLRLFIGGENAPESEFKGLWVQPDVGRLMFISQLILIALEYLRGEKPASALGPHFSSLIQNTQRLVAEVRAMRERYGEEPKLAQNNDNIYWKCVARQYGRELPIEIHYPTDYPYSPPSIRCLISLKAGCPHYINGNQLCWTDVYGKHSDWNPGRDTAVTAFIAAQRWFACYLVWLTLGHWPDTANHH